MPVKLVRGAFSSTAATAATGKHPSKEKAFSKEI